VRVRGGARGARPGGARERRGWHLGGYRVAGDGCAHLCGQYRTWGGGSEGGMDVCGTHGRWLFQERWEDGKSVLVDHIYTRPWVAIFPG
jgi:hypothetical protein